MTVRVYLQAARFVPGPPEPGDLPAERIFVDVASVPELWVETESASVPNTGRVAAFSFAEAGSLGFGRVVGTVERRVNKHTKSRLGEGESPHPSG
jgi:hypothetical protein